jgi:Resolvase, N terminal domain
VRKSCAACRGHGGEAAIGPSLKVGGQRAPRAVAARAVDVQLQAVPADVAYCLEWKRAKHGANRNAHRAGDWLQASTCRTGKPLSKATLHSTLAALKAFFVWLPGQPGYRSLRYSDADYFNSSERDSRIALARREAIPRRDQPFASRLTLHILAAVAEDEARRISERTKAALQAAKARGRKLGSPIAAETVAKARAARCAYAARANATTVAVVREIQASGVQTLSDIAKVLIACGVKTPAGRSEWQAVQVARLLAA